MSTHLLSFQSSDDTFNTLTFLPCLCVCVRAQPPRGHAAVAPPTDRIGPAHRKLRAQVTQDAGRLSQPYWNQRRAGRLFGGHSQWKNGRSA